MALTETEKRKRKEEKKREEKIERVLNAICEVSYTEWGNNIYSLSARKVAEVLANLIV